VESQLRLQGWTRERRVIVLRKKLAEAPNAKLVKGRQPVLEGLSLEQAGGEWYEQAALVTSWEEPEILAVAQAYRDRAEAENMFDELKNQWGWAGFSTQDLKRSQLMARIVALVFNTGRRLQRERADAWGGAADFAWWPDVFKFVEFARQGQESRPVTGGDQRMAEQPKGVCAAVRKKRSLAEYASNHFSVPLRRQRRPVPKQARI